MRFWDGRTLPGRMRGECPRKWGTRWSNRVERKKGGRRAVLLVIAHNARNLRKHLVPFFGRWQMREIGPEEVQRFVSSVKVSGKTAKNLFATIQMLWKSARAWGYVAHDAVSDVVLPKRQRVARRFFSVVEVQRILASVSEPYQTLYWLAVEPPKCAQKEKRLRSGAF